MKLIAIVVFCFVRSAFGAAYKYKRSLSADRDAMFGAILNKYQALGNYNKRAPNLVDLEKFNNCDQETPFPCQTSRECISLKHVCDGKRDCADGYDENESVCIAYHRVPVEDLYKFVKQQARWMVPSFFMDVIKSKEDLAMLASKLSTSPTIDAFQMKMGMSREKARDLERAINAVRNDDIGILEEFNMSPKAYNDVKFVFKNLITSGFLD